MTPPWKGPAGEPTSEDDDPWDALSVSSGTKADVFVETGLVPHDYVVAVVEANGGRLKQQSICDVTGWSDGTVSRILSELEDAGRVHRVWIGRQKIVCLPGAVEELLDLTDADGEEG